MTEQSPEESGAPARRGSDARSRWALAAVLALVAVVSAVALVLEFTMLRPRSAEAAADEQNRSEVVRAAERFAVQTNTYDSQSLADYQKSVTAMLSPTFKDEYTKVIDQLLASIRQAKVTSKGQVLTSAVASLDPDSAQVLVVADANVKTIFNNGLARHFRWEVSLVKIHGRWLVDDFSPVA